MATADAAVENTVCVVIHNCSVASNLVDYS